MVGERRQLLARLVSCTPATCDCSQHTSAPSGSISPRWWNSWRSSGLLSPCGSSLVGLPSISCALIGHPTHLDLGSGLGEPLIPLHFLLTRAAAAAEDCTSVGFCRAGGAGVLSGRLQRAWSDCGCLGFCVSHVRVWEILLHLDFGGSHLQ